ncbi:MAG: hypothetical protein K2P59_01895 [Acetatifactor sp.]|nr:hypothetical protein [Acetatifactor sp.]
MEERKNRCPLCNKMLVIKDGVPACPDCGYRDPYRSGESQTGDSQQQPNYGGQSQANYGQQSNYNQQPVPPAGNTGKQNNQTAIIISIVAIVVVLVLVVAGVFAYVGYNVYREIDEELKTADWGSDSGSESYGEASSASDPFASSYPSSSSTASPGSQNSDVSHLMFNPPESELLKEFVSQLFDKPAASATREDLNSVIRVEIRDIYDHNGTEITYELSDGTAGTCYLASARVDSEDFKCFPKLQILDLGRNSLDWDTDWHNLTSLTSLTCETTLRDLAGYMDVSQLTELELYCDFLMSDCSETGAYSNLEYLKLDCDDHGMELAGLSQAATLKALVIEDGDGISDFGELYDMSQLKELSIESKGLRDIGFISGMSGLESLELAGTQLMQIAAVSDRADTLKSLRLHQNYSVEDYSPIFECTGLEELELYVDYDTNADMVMPDLSMMTGLRALTLGNYDRFPGLGALTALESLTLTDGGYFENAGNLAGVENLTNLKDLALIDMSATPSLLEAFAGVNSLETIDLTDTFIWGDINVVFGMPNLRVLNLEDAEFGLRLEGMPVSESLQELNMEDTTVDQLKEDGSWDFGAGNTKIKLGSHTEFFDHMPGLTALTVPGQELQDVKFAENMPQLTYLNISDNYVTDLSPLAGLDQLKVIVCENNPVHEKTGLKNVIIID